MRHVLKRIAVHGTLAAVALGLIGLMYAELAGLWLTAGRAQGRAGPVEPGAVAAPDPTVDALRGRLPFVLAGAGFLFVAAGEGVLYLLQRRRPVPAPPPSPEADAARLLNELLAREDAKRDPPPTG